MTGGSNARGRTRSSGNIAAIALLGVIIILAASALLAGPAIEDYWTVYLSDPKLDFATLMDRRWVVDIHPPLFNVWAAILSKIGISSIPIARLMSNLPAVVLLVYTARRFAKRAPEQSRFYAIFVLLMLSAPATIKAFGVFGGDFWQMIAFTIQLLLARHVMFVDHDYRSRLDGFLALIGVLATIIAIMLDYGGALFGGVVAMATMLAAIGRGLRRWARLLAVAMVLALTGVVYVISWQAPAWSDVFDLYQNWIEMGDSTSTGILMALIISTVLHNPIAIAGGYLGRHSWDRHDSVFALLIAAALIASLVAISQIDAQRRLITVNNTADIAVLITALMAAAGAKLAQHRLWVIILAAVAVASSLFSLVEIGLDGAWQTGAKRVARIIDSCPQTRIYAASGWRLDVGSDSTAAEREEPVFLLGYERLGHAHHFTPVPVSPLKPAVIVPGPCPTLLWIEQVPMRTHPSPDKILKMAGLTGAAGLKLSTIRTRSGLIISARR